MTTVVYTDASGVFDSVDLSDHIKSITLNYSAEMLDDTAMGDDTRSKKGGLKDWSMDITFHQDYAAANVDATFFALVGSTFSCVLKPTSAAVSATNPSFTGTGILESYSPMGGGVGDLEETTVTIQSAGTLVRATS